MCPSHNTPPQLSLPIHLSSWTWTRDALGIRNPGARFRNLSTADPFSAHSATVHTFGVMITYIQVALAIAIHIKNLPCLPSNVPNAIVARGLGMPSRHTVRPLASSIGHITRSHVRRRLSSLVMPKLHR